MKASDWYKVQIDQLPEEGFQASSPAEAAMKVRQLLSSRASLRALRSSEPVQLKLPDGRPWGRNLSIADYHSTIIETEEPSGPAVEPKVGET